MAEHVLDGARCRTGIRSGIGGLPNRGRPLRSGFCRGRAHRCRRADHCRRLADDFRGPRPRRTLAGVQARCRRGGARSAGARHRWRPGGPVRAEWHAQRVSPAVWPRGAGVNGHSIGMVVRCSDAHDAGRAASDWLLVRSLGTSMGHRHGLGRLQRRGRRLPD
jgi:hypothetical protein